VLLWQQLQLVAAAQRRGDVAVEAGQHRQVRERRALKQHAYATEFPKEVAAVTGARKRRGFGMVLEVFSFTHHQVPVSFQRIYIPAGVRHLEMPSLQLPAK
jgi:hypothetical protein